MPSPFGIRLALLDRVQYDGYAAGQLAGFFAFLYRRQYGAHNAGDGRLLRRNVRDNQCDRRALGRSLPLGGSILPGDGCRGGKRDLHNQSDRVE